METDAHAPFFDARRPDIPTLTREETPVFAQLRKLLRRRPCAVRLSLAPQLERLEDRCTPATITNTSVNLNAADQLMLEMMNRARANPSAAAAQYGIDLNQGLAPGTISASTDQPLAPVQALQTVADQHSFDMVTNHYFSHISPTAGDVFPRMAAAGYSANLIGENIAQTYSAPNDPDPGDNRASTLEDDLFLSPEHRTNILEPTFNEVGVGIWAGAGTVDSLGNTIPVVDATQDFGARPSNVYLTGVVYNDTDGNNFYSLGEGLSGVTVAATNLDNGQNYATTTASGGGYEIPLPSGHYRVTINGVSGTVTIGSANGKIDFQTNTLLGADAGSVTGPPPAPVTPPTPTPPAAKAPPGTFPADQPGVFRNGQWVLNTTHTHVYNPGDAVYNFGQAGDVPVVGDWNGDGKDDIGVFRALPDGAGEFILDTNEDGALDAGDTTFVFGAAGDRIVVGDWNGAGKDEVGVFRSNANGVGVFALDTNGDRVFDAGDDVFLFGVATDKIVIGDWNGDGRDKVGVYRNNGVGVGIFSLDTTGDRQFDTNSSVFLFGLASDTVVIGDWNGDGRSKVGVVRNDGTGQAIWSLDANGNLGFDSSDPVFRYGLATDIPVVGKW
jgi:hypothetical protein